MLKYSYKQLLQKFNKPLNVHINSNNKSIIIKYVYQNKDFVVILPFRKELKTKAVNKKIFLVDNNDNEIQLITQPGIPLFISPDDLGVKEIKIIDDDDILEKYTGNQIIKFFSI